MAKKKRPYTTGEGFRLTRASMWQVILTRPLFALWFPPIFAAIADTPSWSGGPVVGYVDGVAISYADLEEVAASASYRMETRPSS